MIKKSLLCFCLLLIFIVVLSGCRVQETPEVLENIQPVEEFVSFSGIIKEITIFGSYKELVIEIKGEEKIFILNNHTHIFDNSYQPRVEPYLAEDIYVKIEVKKSEMELSKPTIKYISVESYDGIFAV